MKPWDDLDPRVTLSNFKKLQNFDQAKKMVLEDLSQCACIPLLRLLFRIGFQLLVVQNLLCLQDVRLLVKPINNGTLSTIEGATFLLHLGLQASLADSIKISYIFQ